MDAPLFSLAILPIKVQRSNRRFVDFPIYVFGGRSDIVMLKETKESVMKGLSFKLNDLQRSSYYFYYRFYYDSLFRCRR